MPRSKSDQPSYRYHISGQAVVTFTLDGGQKNFYLGEHGSKESRSRYFALLSEYQATGTINVEVATHQADRPITVRAVTAEYRREVDVKYARSPHHARRFRNPCTTLEDEYGDTAAVDFGPIKLAELRDLFVVSGNNRKYANTQSPGYFTPCHYPHFSMPKASKRVAVGREANLRNR